MKKNIIIGILIIIVLGLGGFIVYDKFIKTEEKVECPKCQECKECSEVENDSTANINNSINMASKNVLAVEGNAMVDATKTAYQLAILEGKINGSACFSLEYLYNNDFLAKGANDAYTGSVLVTESNGKFTYKFWISNGRYTLNGVNPGATGKDATNGSVASSNCGETKDIILFK